jgi:hypothetical protein
LQALGLDRQLFGGGETGAAEHVFTFMSLEEIDRAVGEQIAAIDFEALAKKAIKETLYKSIGRV